MKLKQLRRLEELISKLYKPSGTVTKNDYHRLSYCIIRDGSDLHFHLGRVLDDTKEYLSVLTLSRINNRNRTLSSPVYLSNGGVYVEFISTFSLDSIIQLSSCDFLKIYNLIITRKVRIRDKHFSEYLKTTLPRKTLNDFLGNYMIYYLSENYTVTRKITAINIDDTVPFKNIRTGEVVYLKEISKDVSINDASWYGYVTLSYQQGQEIIEIEIINFLLHYKSSWL